MPVAATRTTSQDLDGHERFAPIGKALASPLRLALLELLAQSERTVDELVREIGGRLSTVSSHLQVLRSAHLVDVRREGTHLHYRLAGPDVAALLLQLQAVAIRVLPELAADDDAGSETVERDTLFELAGGPGVLLLDVRPRAEYLAGHLPGAHSVPLDTLEDPIVALPPAGTAAEVVVYARSRRCALARAAARRLQQAGIDARVLLDGVPAWALAGLPIIEGPEPGPPLVPPGSPAIDVPDAADGAGAAPPADDQHAPRSGPLPLPEPVSVSWGRPVSPAGIRAARRIP